MIFKFAAGRSKRAPRRFQGVVSEHFDPISRSVDHVSDPAGGPKKSIFGAPRRAGFEDVQMFRKGASFHGMQVLKKGASFHDVRVLKTFTDKLILPVKRTFTKKAFQKCELRLLTDTQNCFIYSKLSVRNRISCKCCRKKVREAFLCGRTVTFKFLQAVFLPHNSDSLSARCM